jgi:hypothetical protein
MRRKREIERKTRKWKCGMVAIISLPSLLDCYMYICIELSDILGKPLPFGGSVTERKRERMGWFYH